MHLLLLDELAQVYLSCLRDPLIIKHAIEDSSSRHVYYSPRFQVMIYTRWPRVYPPSIRSGESFIGYSITFEYLKVYLIITILATSLETTRVEVKG